MHVMHRGLLALLQVWQSIPGVSVAVALSNHDRVITYCLLDNNVQLVCGFCNSRGSSVNGLCAVTIKVQELLVSANIGPRPAVTCEALIRCTSNACFTVGICHWRLAPKRWHAWRGSCECAAQTMLVRFAYGLDIVSGGKQEPLTWSVQAVHAG